MLLILVSFILAVTSVAIATQSNAETTINTNKKSVYQSVQAATTQKLTLSDPPSSVDGVDLVENMRIVVQNNPGDENGLYILSNRHLVRTLDMNSTAAVVPGGIVFVEFGDTYGNQMLILHVPTLSTSTKLTYGVKQVGAHITFMLATSAMLPAPISNSQVLTVSEGTIEWGNGGLPHDESFTEDGIIVRQGTDLMRTSGITIDNLHNMSGPTSLSLHNVLGSKVKLLLDATSTEDFNINLPSDTPSVGQFLSVSNFDGPGQHYFHPVGERWVAS